MLSSSVLVLCCFGGEPLSCFSAVRLYCEGEVVRTLGGIGVGVCGCGELFVGDGERGRG